VITVPGQRPTLKEVPNTEKEWPLRISTIGNGLYRIRKTIAESIGALRQIPVLIFKASESRL